MKHKVKHVEEQGFESFGKTYNVYKDGIWYGERRTREGARLFKRQLEEINNFSKVVIIQSKQFNQYVR